MTSVARPEGHGVILDEETCRRVRVFVARVGVGVAQRRLGLGAHTLGAARDRGRIAKHTIVKIREALDREELLDADEVAS